MTYHVNASSLYVGFCCFCCWCLTSLHADCPLMSSGDGLTVNMCKGGNLLPYFLHWLHTHCLILGHWTGLCMVELDPLGHLTLPYLTGKASYRLALRRPAGPLLVPDITLRLLYLSEFFYANFKSELQCFCLNSLGSKKCFPKCFLGFPARVVDCVDWCRIFFSTASDAHRILPLLSSAESNGDLMYCK